MSDLLTTAGDYRNDVRRRAVAHELSAEYHRRRGVQFGVAATVVSAIVGSAIFVTVAATLGISGRDTISIPSEGPGLLAFVGFGFLSILAPILTGLQTYLNEPQQSAKHTFIAAEYYRVKGRLDAFIGRYEGP